MITITPSIGERVAAFNSSRNLYEILTVGSVTPTGRINAGGRQFLPGGKQISNGMSLWELIPITRWIEDRVRVQGLIVDAEMATHLAHVRLVSVRNGKESRAFVDSLTPEELETLTRACAIIEGKPR